MRVGSSDSRTGGLVVPAAQIAIHPSYNKNNQDFDLAIVRTARVITQGGVSKTQIEKW